MRRILLSHLCVSDSHVQCPKDNLYARQLEPLGGQTTTEWIDWCRSNVVGPGQRTCATPRTHTFTLPAEGDYNITPLGGRKMLLCCTDTYNPHRLGATSQCGILGWVILQIERGHDILVARDTSHGWPSFEATGISSPSHLHYAVITDCSIDPLPSQIRAV